MQINLNPCKTTNVLCFINTRCTKFLNLPRYLPHFPLPLTGRAEKYRVPGVKNALYSPICLLVLQEQEGL